MARVSALLAAVIAGLLLPAIADADSKATEFVDAWTFELRFSATLDHTRWQAVGGDIISTKVVRDFDLVCGLGDCSLIVNTLPFKYCDNPSAKQTDDFGSVDSDVYQRDRNGSGDLSVEIIGNDTMLIRFKDRILEGGLTDETIILNYRKKYPLMQFSDKTVIGISGSARIIPTDGTRDTARISTYRVLTTPLKCVIVLRPTDK